MKTKQRISLILVLSMLVSMVPSLSVYATSQNPDNREVADEDITSPQDPRPMILFSNPGPGEVEYIRKEPEVAILNRYTGNSAKFYDTLTDPSSGYNGIRLFGETVDSKLYADSSYYAYYGIHGHDNPLIYSGFTDENNVLNQLNKIKDQFTRPVNNLEVGVSGTFHNNWHTHTTSLQIHDTEFSLPEEIEIMSYSGMHLKRAVKGDTQNSISIIKQDGKKKDNETKPRIGNGEFASLRPVDNQDLILWITKSIQPFDRFEQTCMCGGHHIEKAVVAFRDQISPQISKVFMNNENIYHTGPRPTFGPGEEINIEIQYNEPIRFADDSPAGKGDLYIKLVADGVVEGAGEDIHPRAYLTKLDNDTLYFSYTVPEEPKVTYTVSQIDLLPLMGKDIPLKQLGPVAEYGKVTIPVTGLIVDAITGWKNGSFEVEIPSDVQGKALGFTESASYITDLAGNPINNEIIVLPSNSQKTEPILYIDTQDLGVTAIVPILFSRHKQDIKDILGKTDPAAIDYPDKSDTHMGTASYFSFDLIFNKTLDIGNLAGGGYSVLYDGLTVTTNMKDKDSNFISLKSRRAYQTETKNGSVTTINLENTPSLDSEVKCDDEDGKLRVTSISLSEPLKDISDNEFSGLDSVNEALMTKTFYLDNDYAQVTTTLSESGGIYITEPVSGQDRAFRFLFKVEDTGPTASGVNGLTGNFRWVKKSGNIVDRTEDWPFEYIITAKSSLDGTEDWLKGYMGQQKYEFTQIEAGNYLYIRPVAGQVYSLFDTELQFQALDYAGNKREWNDWDDKESFPIDTIWEDQPPVASPADVRRNLNIGGGGTIELDIILKDQSALKENGAHYLWNDGEEPSSGSSWKSAPIYFTPGDQKKEGKITATASVNNGVSFSQHLWVKVADTYNNETIADMGLYEYNLAQLAYELNYSSAITAKASLRVEEIQDGGSLVLMVKDPNRPSEYFVRVFDDTVAGQDAFNNYTSWVKRKVSENSLGYVFEDPENNDMAYIKSIAGESGSLFNGNLQVTVLSGRNEAFDFSTISGPETKYPESAGNDSHPVAKETVFLRVSHNNESQTTDTFPDISFEPVQTINIRPESYSESHPSRYFWTEGDPSFLSTAEGIEFSLDLGEDKYGWNYEDVDFAKSYIELQYLDEAPYNTRFQAYLSSGRRQTVVFPKEDYKKGNYKITLYLKCYVGKDYEIVLSDSLGAPQTMYLDPSPASADFGITSLTYTPSGWQYKDEFYSHGLSTQEYFNWEIDTYSNDQVIYVPAYMPQWSNILTVTINDYEDLPQYGVKVWNVTAGGRPEDAEFSVFESYDEPGTRSFYLTVWDTADEARQEGGQATEWSKTKTKLGLVNNQDNLIAVQVFSRNGQNSQIKYYTIHPVDKAVRASTGVSLGEGGTNVVGQGNVIFSPEPGQLMEGVRVFASPSRDGITDPDGPREMAAQYDGTYTCPLSEGLNYYYIYSIDRYGNLNLYDMTVSGQQINLSPPYAILDKTPPVVTYLDKDTDEGMYEAVFKIEDDTINARAYSQVGGYSTAHIPLDISLYFDSDYTKNLGLYFDSDNTEELDLQGVMNLDFTINEDKYEFIWMSQKRSPTGIYEVRAVRKSEGDANYLEVTVKGAVAYKKDDTLQTFTLYMDARDAFGNSTVSGGELGSGSVTFNDISSAQPLAYTYPERPDKSPKYDYVSGKYGGSGNANKGLIIEFNTPVLPESSWINPEPQYGRVQERAFPITKDGPHEIKYYDVFGNPFIQELDIWVIMDADAGISVDITPEDLTADDVIVRIVKEGYFDGGGILLFKKEGEDLTLVSDDESSKSDITNEKQITLTENTSLVVYRLPKHYNYKTYEEMIDDDFGLINCYETEIHISNIIKGEPTAEAYLYFTETGREYAAKDVLPGQTSGNIQVRYTSSRKLFPTEGTEAYHTFKHGESDTYTFKFVDDLGQAGSLTVDLKALGVSIVGPSLVVDSEDPLITVDMYAKQFDLYSPVNSFSSSATAEDIKSAFDAIGYVQGYLFEINVLDQSDYKIVLMKEEPQGELSYETAVSDNIEGASLLARTVTVTENLSEDLYLVVVDNAKAETGAEKDNYTYIFLDAGNMTAWFDTIPPTAITEVVSNSLYNTTVYISFSDKANADSEKETGLVTLTSPELERVIGATGETEKYNGWYKLEFYDNSSKELIFNDMAGNRATYTINIDEIDSSKPGITTTWLPAYISNDGELDTSRPTLGPVNIDVKAIITSDKPMREPALEYTTDGENWKNWPSPYLGLPPSSIGYTFNPDRITLIFKGKVDESPEVIGVRVKVKAPNNEESELVVFLSEGVIDKTPPEINPEVNYLYREGFSLPYGGEIVLSPNEAAYSLNGGKAGVLYDTDNPLTIKTTSNGTSKYRFSDKAGNIGSVDVTTQSIDTSSPIITTDPKDTKNFPSSTEVTVKISVNEKCRIEYEGEDSPFTLEANEEKELTFTENGVHLIKAYDLAGNTALATVVIGNIDKTAPMISFDNMTIKIRQDSEESKLEEMLKVGVNMWDNLDKFEDLIFTYNLDGVNGVGKVDLGLPGLYQVPYTVTDTAGNKGYATRYVRVFDKNMPGIIIDDTMTEPDGTTVLFQGDHRLTIEGLKLIAPGEMEPYTIKICNGIRSEGQMKYYPSNVAVDSEGNFTLSQKGFYTLYIITQSRQTYRTLLYVEK